MSGQTALAARRLRREYSALTKNPVENILAHPLETNILEWHYVITGTADSPYEGGHYHGYLKFPPEYPLKPPSVLMCTPSGRFKTNRRLCLSMSDYHPETWNPMWSVSTILTGLYSFMLESAPTLGSVEATDAQRRQYARESLEFNCKDATFIKLFPELVELQEERARARALEVAAGGGSEGTGSAPDGAADATAQEEAAVVPKAKGEENNFATFVVLMGVVLGILVLVLLKAS